MKKILDENTLVPISLLIIIIGFVYWLSTVALNGEANTDDIREIKTEHGASLKEINASLQSIKLELGEMKLMINNKAEGK